MPCILMNILLLLKIYFQLLNYPPKQIMCNLFLMEQWILCQKCSLILLRLQNHFYFIHNLRVKAKFEEPINVSIPKLYLIFRTLEWSLILQMTICPCPNQATYLQSMFLNIKISKNLILPNLIYMSYLWQ